MNANQRVFIFFLSFGLWGFVSSDCIGQSSKAIPALHGEKLRLEDALSQSECIVLASLEYIGEPSLAGLGEARFDKIQFLVKKTLKGNCGKELTVTLFAKSDLSEEVPKAGKDFIVFVVTADDHLKEVIKLMRPDANTIKIIAAASSNQK